MSLGADSKASHLAIDSAEGLERLQRLFRYAQVGRCVNSVTHDLNNYLGAIMAYAELVAMEPGLSDESRRMLNEIAGGVKRSSDLVNDLTSIARKERPNVNLVSMTRLAERVYALRRYDFQINRVEVVTTFQESAGDIAVDQPKIECAIIYLLANALEQALETGVKKVRFGVCGAEEYVEIAVANEGEPVAPDLRESIFEPFFTTKGEMHLGLGLALTREIATLHDGSATYEPDRGFILRIPRAGRMSQALASGS